MALGGLARTLGVGPDDPAVTTARDAYLDGFADLAAHADLVRTAETACRAAVVARALTWHRAVGPAGPEHPFAAAAGHPRDPREPVAVRRAVTPGRA